MLPLADSTVAQIGDPIRILGFPGVVLSHELLNQSASVDASVTNGAVSGFKQDKANNPYIQTDAPAAWGNSGGPVINSRAELLGVLTFVSLAPGPEGSIVQGFNFIIPAQGVKDFVKDTAVKINDLGKFNPVWFAGLHDFFTEDWKDAVRKFEQADTILAGLTDVKRMLGEAREKVKNPPPKPFPWFWVAIGVTFLSAGGYGTQVMIRWKKNRYRVGPSEVIKLLESGKQPLILDTRAQQAYDQNPIKIHGSIRLSPDDLKKLPEDVLPQLADEVRAELIRVMSDENPKSVGGHLGPGDDRLSSTKVVLDFMARGPMPAFPSRPAPISRRWVRSSTRPSSAAAKTSYSSKRALSSGGVTGQASAGRLKMRCRTRATPS